MTAPSDCAKRGYTLLELLVILAILSTIATLAVPVSGRLVEGLKLQTDGRALIVTLRNLRDHAVNSQRKVVVENDAKSLGLTTDEGVPLDLPDGSTATVAGERTRFMFFPDGTSDGAEIHVSRDGQSIDIRVIWLLGDIGLEPAE